MPGENTPLHPVAIYAAVIALLLTMVGYRRPSVAATLVSVGTAQFLLCFLRQPGISSIAGLDLLQVVALGMIVAGCGLLLANPNPPSSVPSDGVGK